VLDPGYARVLAGHLAESAPLAARDHTAVALVEVDDWQLNRERMGDDWCQEATGFVTRQMHSSFLKVPTFTVNPLPQGSWMLVARTSVDESITRTMSDLANRLLEECRREATLTISVAVSREHRGSDALPRACDEAICMIQEKLITGGDRLWLEPTWPEGTRLDKPGVRRVEDQIVGHVRAGEWRRVHLALENWIDEVCRDPGVSSAHVTRWLTGLSLHIMDVTAAARLADGSADWSETLRRCPDDPFRMLTQVHERSALTIALRDMIQWFEVETRPAASLESATGPLLESIEQFIRDNYASNLSLGTVAEALYVSPFYVSKLFQRERGTTFLTFLTGVRMRHARALLAESSMQVDAIAHAVGFRSPKHFRARFKQLFNMTPMAFRRDLANQRLSCEVA
jgi:two-component system response regulator YesN